MNAVAIISGNTHYRMDECIDICYYTIKSKYTINLNNALNPKAGTFSCPHK